MGLNLTVLAATVAALTFSVPVLADEIDGWCAEYRSDAHDGVHKLIITRDKDKVKVHAYAVGFPSDIDWGEATAEVYHAEHDLPSVVAHFTGEKTETMIVIVPNTGGNPVKPGGLIRVSTYVKSPDGQPQKWSCSDFRSTQSN